jgi:hypothetical protein
VSPLERRCRTLLLAYPRWYRRQRGDEMLATLLEASQPGQLWPSARDARALIVGGLRVRAVLEQRLTTAANLRLAAQLGAVLTVLVVVVGSMTNFVMMGPRLWVYPGPGYWLAYGLLGLAAVIAAWFAPRPVVAILAVAAAVAGARVYWGRDVAAIVPAALLVILAVLVFLGERMPRAWLWLAGAWFAANGLQALTPVLTQHYRYPPLTVVLWTILATVLLWALVDARPAMAVAIYIACTYVISHLLGYAGYGLALPPVFSLQVVVPAAVAAVLASGAFWRLRRQKAL